MSFDIFGWLRRKVAEAFVQGLADGAAAVTPEGEPAPANLGELRAMLAAAVPGPKALPAAKDDTDDDPPAKRKKGT